MGSEPKRHHYLTQSYLEGFCRDGKLWVYDRERRRFREQTPRNTAVRGHYYSFTDETGKRNPSVETMLARIESDAKPALSRLRARERLLFEERKNLALFLAFLRTRVPEFHEFMQEANEKLTKWMLEMMAAQEGALESALAAEPKGTGVTVAGLRDIISRDGYSIPMERDESLKLMLDVSFGLANALLVARWAVLRAPKGTSFVTSDNPVVPIYQPRSELDEDLGFFDARLTKIVPLAADTLLMMHGEDGWTVFKDISKADVRRFNIHVSQWSTYLLVGRDRALVESMVSKAGIRGPADRQRVKAIRIGGNASSGRRE